MLLERKHFRPITAYNRRFNTNIINFTPKHAERLSEKIIHESDQVNNAQFLPIRQHIGRMEPLPQGGDFATQMRNARITYGIPTPMNQRFRINEGIDIWQTLPLHANSATPWHLQNYVPAPAPLPSHEIKHKISDADSVSLSYFQRRQALYYIVYKFPNGQQGQNACFVELWVNKHNLTNPPQQQDLRLEQARIINIIRALP